MAAAAQLAALRSLRALIEQKFPDAIPLARRTIKPVATGIAELDRALPGGGFPLLKLVGVFSLATGALLDYAKGNKPQHELNLLQKLMAQFKAGDLKENKIEEAKEKMEKLRAAVNEFDRFQKLMRSRNRYDFDDMINWVINAFEENKTLLSRYQEQFLYILVDE